VVVVVVFFFCNLFIRIHFQELRENGLLKDLWVDMPEWLAPNRNDTKRRGMEFYGVDVEVEMRRVIAEKYQEWKNARAKNKLPDEAAVRREIDTVIRECSAYYYTCAEECGPGKICLFVCLFL
jgi:hypothetical protein